MAAAVAALAGAGGAGASAAPGGRSPAPSPSPSPTLPVPASTVDPDRSVGGPRLASMGVVLDAPAGVPAPPAVRDVAWLVADADTGEVLAAKAPHARLRPASTLKALTATTLIPTIDPDAVHRATEADAAADGTRVGLLPGRTYTARQLFSGLVMASGNDAAYALAEMNGGRAATVAELNARARELGAHDTVVRDPSGLDAPGQVSSAYDLALIGRAAVRDPEYVRYATTREVRFPGRVDPKTGKPTTYVVGNHNRLLYNYPGTIGVKNGYTVAAHRTFIAAARRGGKTYLVTEMYGLDGGWRPTASLLDWAFRHGPRVTPVGRLVEPGEVPRAPVAGPSPSATASPVPSPSATGTGDPAPTRATTAASLGTTEAGPWVGAATLAASVALVLGYAVRARRARRRTSADG
ncbi:MAG TPA: serine hydrolase [Dermatophilaceae bacterium]|nr:serine hydrolase [Dermatophilaceae bacterium]